MTVESFTIDCFPKPIIAESVEYRTASLKGPTCVMNDPDVLRGRTTQNSGKSAEIPAGLSLDSLSDSSSDEEYFDEQTRHFLDRLRHEELPLDASDPSVERVMCPESEVLQQLSDAHYSALTYLQDALRDSPAPDLEWAMQVQRGYPAWLAQMPCKLAARMSLSDFQGYLAWLQDRRHADLILQPTTKLFEYASRVRDSAADVQKWAESMDDHLWTQELTNTQRIVLGKIRKSLQWNAHTAAEFARKVEDAWKAAYEGASVSLDIVDRAVGTLRAAVKFRIEALKAKIDAKIDELQNSSTKYSAEVEAWDVEIEEWAKMATCLVQAINAQARGK